MSSNRRCCCCAMRDGRGVKARCRWVRERCGTSSCVSVCTKAYLVIVNFIFLLSGWILLGLGLWLHVYREAFAFTALLKDNPTHPVLIIDHVTLALIAVGGFIIVVSFLGCCGACTESVCFLGFYAFLLIAAVVIQVCIASLTTTFRKQIIDDLDESMHYQIRYEYNATGTRTNRTDTDEYRTTAAWDALQVKLECCGASGPNNYHQSRWFNHTSFAEGDFVPVSCCVPLDLSADKEEDGGRRRDGGGGRMTGSDASIAVENRMSAKLKDHLTQCQIDALRAVDGNDAVSLGRVKTQGCHAALVQWSSRYEYLVSILFFIIVLQIVDFVYACILMSWVRKTLADYSWCENDDFQ